MKQLLFLCLASFTCSLMLCATAQDRPDVDERLFIDDKEATPVLA